MYLYKELVFIYVSKVLFAEKAHDFALLRIYLNKRFDVYLRKAWKVYVFFFCL